MQLLKKLSRFYPLKMENLVVTISLSEKIGICLNLLYLSSSLILCPCKALAVSGHITLKGSFIVKVDEKRRIFAVPSFAF